MPILEAFVFPDSAEAIPISNKPTFFIAFLSSKNPASKQPWCPDVRAALPTLEATFKQEDSPTAAFVEVGQRAEWKDPANVFRTRWNVNSIPALIRFQKVGSAVQEVGRLTEGEILDEKRLQQLVSGEYTR